MLGQLGEAVKVVGALAAKRRPNNRGSEELQGHLVGLSLQLSGNLKEKALNKRPRQVPTDVARSLQLPNTFSLPISKARETSRALMKALKMAATVGRKQTQQVSMGHREELQAGHGKRRRGEGWAPIQVDP